MEVLQEDAIHCRWMIRRDLESVTKIGHAPEELYLSLLRQKDVIGMVAEVDQQVVGYMLYRIMPKEHTLVLLLMRVANDKRRMGIGKNLLDKLKRKLDFGRYRAVIADIEEVDLESQLFMRAVGFEAVAIVERPDNLLGLKSSVCYRFQYPIWKGSRHGKKGNGQEADASTEA